MTRSPLSEAMKFTVFTRGSRSTVSRKCFRNNDPLAPVVATVRFSGARKARSALHELDLSARPRKTEDRDAAKASQGEGRSWLICHPERSEGPMYWGASNS